MGAESLKEYLVKIGWDVNEIGFNKANRQLNFFKLGIENAAVGMASKFMKSSDFIISSITSVTKSLLELIDTTASADLETERFARKFWTTEQNARSLSVALDSLGMEYDDLFYATNEQYNRFVELNKLGKTMEAPKALDETLVRVRDIQFEFSKLKMIFSYGGRWVTYWFGQYLGADIDNIHDKLKSMNDFLIHNLPAITEKVAKFFMVFYKLGKAAFTVIYSFSKAVFDFLDKLPAKAKAALIMLNPLMMKFLLSPIGLITAALVGLLLLIDDFETWERGGKSYFGDKWQGVKDILDKMGSSTVPDLKKNLGDVLDDVGHIFDLLGGNQAVMDFVSTFLEGVDWLLKGVSGTLELINDTLAAINGNLSEISDNSIMGKFLEKHPGATDWFENFGIDMKNGWNDFKSFFGYGDSTKDTMQKNGAWDDSYANSFDNQDQFYDFWKKYYGYESAGTAARTTTGASKTTNNKTVNVTNKIGVYPQTNASPSDIANATANKIGNNRYWNQTIQ